MHVTHNFMRPKELVPILAELFGVSMETAWVLDRSLANHGLRTASKGRKPLDMTRRDAVHFLFACMTADVRVRAIDDVRYWTALEWGIPKKGVSREKAKTKKRHATYLDEPLEIIEPPMGHNIYIVEPARKISADGQVIGIVDYLLLLMRWPHGPDGTTKFEISTTGNSALVEYEVWGTVYEEFDSLRPEFKRYTDYFLAPRDLERRPAPDEQTGIHRSVHVYGEALMEIAHRTDDPLEGVLG